MRHLTPEMIDCMKRALACEQACLETLSDCLQRGGKHASFDHIRLLQDCIDSCRTTTAFVSRDSEFLPDECSLCADICEACIESCEDLGPEEMMKRCIDACQACISACRSVSATSSADLAAE